MIVSQSLRREFLPNGFTIKIGYFRQKWYCEPIPRRKLFLCPRLPIIPLAKVLFLLVTQVLGLSHGSPDHSFHRPLICKNNIFPFVGFKEKKKDILG